MDDIEPTSNLAYYGLLMRRVGTRSIINSGAVSVLAATKHESEPLIFYEGDDGLMWLSSSWYQSPH
jgi:hypothetical protein